MAIIPDTADVVDDDVEYPYADGRPVAETPIHRDNLLYSVYRLKQWFAHDPLVYVSGNMFLYYERGNTRKNVAPDVFVVLGASRDKPRRVYKVWEEEGRTPDMVIEITSRNTQREDMEDKFELYQDILRVREYFLFDPDADYLDPPLWGCRLCDGEYVPIAELDGRLPSEVTGLHLEKNDIDLRFYDPIGKTYLLTPPELRTAFDRQKWETERLETRIGEAESQANQFKTRNTQLEEENERLRAELDALRKKSSAEDGPA